MFRKFIFVLWLPALLISAGCNKNEDILDFDYTGTLSLVYSRSFPSFDANTTLDVYIAKSGEVTLSTPSPANYDATAEEPEVVKIREFGSLIVNNPKGKVVIRGDESFVQITTATIVVTNMIVWGWDGTRWIEVASLLFNTSNPVDNPMNFSISDAAWSGSTLGATVPAFNGTMTFAWTLRLTPIP